jgi:hypothetical protein
VDTTPNMTANEFEAYTAKSKTKLAGETTLGAQTDQLMREAPGQIEVITDPITGESKTVQKGGGAVEVEQQEFKTVTPTMVETPFEKAARMSAAFPMKKSPDLDKAYELIQRQNELAQKQQRLDNLFKGGDLALNLYRTYKTASEPLTTTALKGGAFDTTSFMGTQVGKSTLGSVGTAGAIGYGVGSALKIKGPKTAGAGAAIGTAVGGPVGGVIGGVVGGAVGEVTGKVVCTAMYQTTLLPEWKKHMKVWQIFERKYLTPYHEIGYHILFKPFAKGMLKNKFLRLLGAHVAKHRTQDLKHILFNSKFDLLGRIYRKILEPICYLTGKIKSWQ